MKITTQIVPPVPVPVVKEIVLTFTVEEAQHLRNVLGSLSSGTTRNLLDECYGAKPTHAAVAQFATDLFLKLADETDKL